MCLLVTSLIVPSESLIQAWFVLWLAPYVIKFPLRSPLMVPESLAIPRFTMVVRLVRQIPWLGRRLVRTPTQHKTRQLVCRTASNIPLTLKPRRKNYLLGRRPSLMSTTYFFRHLCLPWWTHLRALLRSPQVGWTTPPVSSSLLTWRVS